MITRVIYAAAACGVMAACSGGSSLDRQLQASEDTANQISAEFVDGQDPLAAASLPTSGTASYAGSVAAFGGTGDPRAGTARIGLLYVGDLTMDIDFGSGRLNGAGQNFVRVSNLDDVNSSATDVDLIAAGPARGTLAIEGRQLPRSTDARYDIEIVGSISGNDDDFLDFSEAGLTGSAAVYGDNADAVAFDAIADAEFADQQGFIGASGVAGR